MRRLGELMLMVEETVSCFKDTSVSANAYFIFNFIHLTVLGY